MVGEPGSFSPIKIDQQSSYYPKILHNNPKDYYQNSVVVLKRYWIVSPLFPFARVVSSSFINSALKNEIWKIPLQIFVFWML